MIRKPCPRCGLLVRWVVGKGVNNPARHNAHGKPCLRASDLVSEAAPEPQPNFSLSMETRGIVIKGEAFVVEGALNVAAAWADLAAKLEALGIRVLETFTIETK